MIPAISPCLNRSASSALNCLGTQATLRSSATPEFILGHLTDSVSHSGVTTTLCTFELPVDNPEGIGYLISGLHSGMNSRFPKLFTGPSWSTTFQDYPEYTRGEHRHSRPRPQDILHAQDLPRQHGAQSYIPHRRECRTWAGCHYVRFSVRQGSATDANRVQNAKQ